MGTMVKFVGALMLTASVPVVAAAQSAEVESQLVQVTSTYRTKGYGPAGWERRGTLATTNERREAVPLKAGRSYSIVGVCERKCTDLDFQLFDASGKEVDFDATDDAIPVVVVNVPTAQTYTLRIVMSACGQAACAFGAKAFIKDQK